MTRGQNLGQLNSAASSIIGANGEGRVTFGPTTLETWHVTRLAVIASSNVLEPIFRVYVDTESPGSLLASTYTGSGDSSDENLHLRPGQRLIGVWSGGDVGARVTLSAFGEKYKN